MQKIIEKILTSEEKSDFNTALKELLLQTIKDEFESMTENDWLFSTEYINNQFDEMFKEALSEVKEEIKKIMLHKMMEKVDNL